MSRAVCRNCWTWYSKGETTCPNCHIGLTAADSGASAFGADASTPAPTPAPATPPSAAFQLAAPAALQPAVQPSPRRIDWLQSGIAYILLIGIIVSGVLLTGGPPGSVRTATSSDGAFSVNVPQGWIQGEASPSDSETEVLALVRIKETNGVQSHFFVGVFGEFAPLSDLEEGWQAFINTGKSPVAGQFGALTRTMVAGTQALTVDFQGSKYGGQLLFVDYGRKTYIIQMSSDPSEFSEVRESDLAAILSSWEWR